MDEQASVPNSGSGGCKCELSGERPRRNLVVCIDGTSNQFGPKNTNVIELYSQLVKSDIQLTYYNSGIGTYAKPSWRSPSYVKLVLSNKVDLAIAWNFEKIVMSAYRWLVDNYRNGDRIFLFGFSRGAYQVRTLAGMIHKVGLIYKGNEDQIPFAYELYADPTSGRVSTSTSGSWRSLLPLSSKEKAEMAAPPKVNQTKNKSPSDRFKSTFSRENVRVHFIGVWDTVSSIGIIRGKNLPGTVSPGHTCFFRHALALDECRVKFLPEYACGGVMLEKGSEEPQDAREQPLRQDVRGNTTEQAIQPEPERIQGPHIKEVWFPGTHSDIGGGNVVNGDLDRRHPAFLWMAYEAISAELRLNTSNVEWKWKELGAVHESLTGVWKIFEYLPFKRLTYKNAHSHTWRWHRCRGRKIQPGQRVHASVAFCGGHTYYPKAVLPEENGKAWSELVGVGERDNTGWTRGWGDLLEMDIFDLSAAKMIFQELPKPKNPAMWAHRLTVMTWSHEGCQALRGVENAAGRLVDMTQELSGTDIHVAVANAIMELAGDDPELIRYIGTLRDHLDSKEFLQKVICNAEPSYEKLESIAILVKDGMPSPEVDGSRGELDNPHHKGLDSQIVQTLLGGLRSKDQDAHQSTLGAVVGLARHGGLRQKMLDSNIVDFLLLPISDEGQDVNQLTSKAVTESTQHADSRCNKLGSDTAQVPSKGDGESKEDVIQSTFDAIAKLARYEDLRRKMLDSNVVVALLKSLTDKHRKTCRPVLNAITELAQYVDSHDKMLDSDILVILLKKLREHNLDLYVAILHTITQFTLNASFKLPSKILAGVMVTLLKRLSDKDWDVRRSTLNAIRHFAKHDDSRVKILDSNVVVALLKSPQDSDEYVRETALETIAELAEHSDSRKMILSHSNMIAALLKRLGGGSNYIDRHGAFDVIMELAKHDDSRGKMMNSNCLQVQSKNLGNKDPSIRQSTLMVITELAKHDDSRNDMVNSDFIMVVLNSLNDDDNYVHGATIGVIAEFAKHDNARNNMLRCDANIVGAILKAADDHWGGIEDSLNVIAELAMHDNFRKNMLRFDSDIVGTILKMAAKHWGGLEASLNVIAKFAKYYDLRNNMLHSNLGIGGVLEMLGDDDGDVRQAASNVIMELEKYENSSRKLLVSDCAAIQLENLRDDKNWKVRRRALWVITGLEKHELFRVKLLGSGIVGTLLTSLRNHNDDIRHASLNAINELAKHDDSRSNILDPDVVMALLKNLEFPYTNVILAALSVVAELAKYDNSRIVILNHNILASVLDLLKTHYQSDIIVPTLEVTTVLAKYDNSRRELNSDIIEAILKYLAKSQGCVHQAALNVTKELAKHDDSRHKLLDPGIRRLVLVALTELANSSESALQGAQPESTSSLNPPPGQSGLADTSEELRNLQELSRLLAEPAAARVAIGEAHGTEKWDTGSRPLHVGGREAQLVVPSSLHHNPSSGQSEPAGVAVPLAIPVERARRAYPPTAVQDMEIIPSTPTPNPLPPFQVSEVPVGAPPYPPPHHLGSVQPTDNPELPASSQTPHSMLPVAYLGPVDRQNHRRNQDYWTPSQGYYDTPSGRIQDDSRDSQFYHGQRYDNRTQSFSGEGAVNPLYSGPYPRRAPSGHPNMTAPEQKFMEPPPPGNEGGINQRYYVPLPHQISSGYLASHAGPNYPHSFHIQPPPLRNEGASTHQYTGPPSHNCPHPHWAPSGHQNTTAPVRNNLEPPPPDNEGGITQRYNGQPPYQMSSGYLAPHAGPHYPHSPHHQPPPRRNEGAPTHQYTGPSSHHCPHPYCTPSGNPNPIVPVCNYPEPSHHGSHLHRTPSAYPNMTESVQNYLEPPPPGNERGINQRYYVPQPHQISSGYLAPHAGPNYPHSPHIQPPLLHNESASTHQYTGPPSHHWAPSGHQNTTAPVWNNLEPPPPDNEGGINPRYNGQPPHQISSGNPHLQPPPLHNEGASTHQYTGPPSHNCPHPHWAPSGHQNTTVPVQNNLELPPPGNEGGISQHYDGPLPHQMSPGYLAPHAGPKYFHGPQIQPSPLRNEGASAHQYTGPPSHRASPNHQMQTYQHAPPDRGSPSSQHQTLPRSTPLPPQQYKAPTPQGTDGDEGAV